MFKGNYRTVFPNRINTFVSRYWFSFHKRIMDVYFTNAHIKLFGFVIGTTNE